MTDPEFKMGPAWSGNSCCGKPIGCTNVSEGCVMRNHRWKREVYGTAHPLAAEPPDPETPEQ